MRAFVAIELAESVRTRLADLQRRMRESGHRDGFQWVRPENLHLTLLFLGQIDQAEEMVVREAMDVSVAESRGLRLSCRSLGCFPNALHPRVLWAGVDDDGALSHLQAALVRSCHPIAGTEMRGYNPHITLARIRDGAWSADEVMLDALAPYGNEHFGTWTPNRIVLMESRSGPHGTLYDVRAEAALASTT
jgi:RNA 2',3'-cyclic 3'-phosphodiesterase